MHADKINILVIYHSFNGCVQLVGEEIARGASTAPGAAVVCKSVEQVTDDDLIRADGIAFGSLKYYGSFSPEFSELFRRIGALRSRFAYKVGCAFTGSSSAFGGQDMVINTIMNAMMRHCDMIAIGIDHDRNGFVGAYIAAPQLEGESAAAANRLGRRLADVSGLIKRGLSSANAEE